MSEVFPLSLFPIKINFFMIDFQSGLGDLANGKAKLTREDYCDGLGD